MKKILLALYVFFFTGGCYDMKEKSQERMADEAVKQTIQLERIANELEKINKVRDTNFLFSYFGSK